MLPVVEVAVSVILVELGEESFELEVVHALRRLHVVAQHVVAVEVRAVVEGAVGVVLREVVEIVRVVRRLLPLDDAQVGEHHVVVGEVLVIRELVELRYHVRELRRVIIGLLVGRGLRIAGRKPAARRRGRAQRVGRRALPLAGVLLPVVLIKRVRRRVIAEVLPVEYAVYELEYRRIPAALILRRGPILEIAVVYHLVEQVTRRVAVAAPGIGRRVGILEHVRAERFEVVVTAVVAAYVAAVARAYPLRAEVRELAVGVRRRVVPVALIAQEAHSGVGVLLRKREVGVGEFAEQPARLRGLPELVVGVSAPSARSRHSRHRHNIPPYCLPGLLLRPLPIYSSRVSEYIRQPPRPVIFIR